MFVAPNRTLVLFLLLTCVLCCGAWASEPEAAGGNSPPTGEVRQLSAESPVVVPDHPLSAALDDLQKELAYLRREVHDFTCRVVKRERINGLLQDYQYIDMWVREAARDTGGAASPLAVYMEFRGPSDLAGRRALYVEGENNGKVLVRKGGDRFAYVVTEISPDGPSARTESLLPITQSGFTPMLEALIGVLEVHAAADPNGQNTKVERIAGAKLNDRACDVIKISHPRRQDDLTFHAISIFIDAELHVPVRIAKLDWPQEPEDAPPVIAEYNYTHVKLNVGLADRMFDERLLKAKH